MAYFRIDASSVHFCGFDSVFYAEAESEKALIESQEMVEIEEFMYDFISGWGEDEDVDEYDEPYIAHYNIEEIDEETWLKEKDWDNRYN